MNAFVKISGVWRPVRHLGDRVAGANRRFRRAYAKEDGLWRLFYQEEVVVTLANASSVVLKGLFALADWNNPKIVKRVIIPAGVTIGASTVSYAIATTVTADGQAGSFAGSLILENKGNIMGRGGVANSGEGGTAILANFPGKQGQEMLLLNSGNIYGGGGGGGKGGNGGNSTYVQREPSSGWSYSYPAGYIFGANNSSVTLWWNGSRIYHNESLGADGPNVTSLTIGDWTYLRGILQSTPSTSGAYSIARQRTASSSGGVGGNGARGQGHDGPSETGSNGSAGGTNAGAGGKGGNGGGWGQNGSTGATGANGNVSNGTAGATGGLAGAYIKGSGNVELVNTGDVRGRLLA